MKERQFTLSEAAKIVGVHPKTLQRLDREGVYKANRTSTNRRYYTDGDILYMKAHRIDAAKVTLSKDIIAAVGRYHARVES